MRAPFVDEPAVAQGQQNHKPSSYLTYHEIVEGNPEYLYSVSLRQFEEHARCLKQLQVAGQLGNTSHHITFDDGHTSQYIHPLPVLQNLSLKAIFFITVGWTEKRYGYMSWSQLAELIQCGHEVQSHGWSHALLTQCSKQALEAELVRSKCELEDHLGVSVNTISMPAGRWNKRVLEACKKAGYERVFTSDPWMSPTTRTGMQVTGRWMATRNLLAERIPLLLEGKGAAMWLLRAGHLGKATAKALLGENAYGAIWRRVARKKKSLEIPLEPSSFPGETKD